MLAPAVPVNLLKLDLPLDFEEQILIPILILIIIKEATTMKRAAL